MTTKAGEAEPSIWDNYDPERARKALHASRGALRGVDRELLLPGLELYPPAAIQEPAEFHYIRRCCGRGASNPSDERKPPQSKDGENWWGSCYSPPAQAPAGSRVARIRSAAALSTPTGQDRFSGSDTGLLKPPMMSIRISPTSPSCSGPKP